MTNGDQLYIQHLTKRGLHITFNLDQKQHVANYEHINVITLYVIRY